MTKIKTDGLKYLIWFLLLHSHSEHQYAEKRAGESGITMLESCTPELQKVSSDKAASFSVVKSTSPYYMSSI